jgi:DNA-binding transcriptional LysR family regulator
MLLAGGSAMHRLVPRALISFLREHPDVDVTVAEQRTPVTVRMLADGEADLGIVLDDEPHYSGLETEPLGDDSLVVIGQPGGVLSGRTSIAYREVAEHPMVGLDVDSSLRRSMDKNLSPHRPVERYRTLVANLTTVVALASAGVGLAVVPRRAVGDGRPVDRCELEDSWARRHHLLCWGARTQRSSAIVAALAEHLRRSGTFDGPLGQEIDVPQG